MYCRYFQKQTHFGFWVFKNVFQSEDYYTSFCTSAWTCKAELCGDVTAQFALHPCCLVTVTSPITFYFLALNGLFLPSWLSFRTSNNFFHNVTGGVCFQSSLIPPMYRLSPPSGQANVLRLWHLCRVNRDISPNGQGTVGGGGESAYMWTWAELLWAGNRVDNKSLTRRYLSSLNLCNSLGLATELLETCPGEHFVLIWTFL